MRPMRFTRGTQSLWGRVSRGCWAKGFEVRDGLPCAAALGLHELDGQAEEAARFVAHHLKVIFFAGTGQGIPPEEIHALAPV